MIQRFYCGTLLVLSLTVLPLQAESSKDSIQKVVMESLSPKEQFLAGVIIMNRSNILGDSAKVSYYYQGLKEITGISDEEGRNLLESYKKSPEKWNSSLQDVDRYLLQTIRQKADSLKALSKTLDTLQHEEVK